MPSNAFAARNAYLQFLNKTKPDILQPTKPTKSVKKLDATAAACSDIKLDPLLPELDSRHQRDFDDGGSITDSLSSEDTKAQEEEVVSANGRALISPGVEVQAEEENLVDAPLVIEAVDQRVVSPGVEVQTEEENLVDAPLMIKSVNQTVEASSADAAAPVSVERPIDQKDAKCDYFDQDIKQEDNANTVLVNEDELDEPPAPVVEPHSPAQEMVKGSANMHAIPSPPSSPASAITPDFGFRHLKLRASAIIKIQRFWRMKRMVSQKIKLTAYTSHLEQKYGVSFDDEHSLSKSVHRNSDSIQQEGDAMMVVDNLPTVHVVESHDFESLCETSTCSFEDIVHDILMESGRWMYERVCDPLDDDFDIQVPAPAPAQQAVDVQGQPTSPNQGQQQQLRSVPASLSPNTTTGSTIPEDTVEFNHLKTRAAAITKIQRIWRMKRMLSQNREFTSYTVRISKKSATKIQTQRRSSAIKVQAKWRMYAARTRFVSIISAIKVQAKWRMYAARTRFISVISAIKVQSHWRRYEAKRDYTYLRSVIKVQTHWRRYEAKRDFTYIGSIIKVQAQWRSYQAKRDYIYIRSIIKVQAQWRSYQARQKFEQFVGAVVVLQSIMRAIPYRNFIAHKACVKEQRLKAASTRIQTLYRGYSTRCIYDIDEIVYQIIVFQSLFRRMKAIDTRCTIEELNYLLMVALVRKIQRAYRNYKQGSTITKRLMAQRRQNYGRYNEEKVMSNTYVIDFEEEFESKCCNTSRCGLDDTVHAILMESGRWIYELVGDPLDVETAENLITVMEISEEASGCLCWKNTTDEQHGKVHSAPQVVRRTSVVAIQSKWRQYIAAKRVCSMKRRALLV
ncbi:hypothetical protein ACHAWO_003184 [Cyclotella atomus]|uniref:Uncharacterized protein n=1 Tax=Cyclotella atomus TaxID=382360 RepID=A0ABD3PHT5_9STRA